MHHANRPSHRRERGNAIIVGLSLFALLGFAAMAVDVGFTESSREEMQATIDASALSAVGELDGSDAGMTRAVTMAKNMALRNKVMQRPVTLEDDEIQLGVYEDGTFTVSSDAEVVNAIQITRASEPVTPFLSMAAFGASMTYSVDALAQRPWAYGNAGSVDCYIPLAIPDCNLSGLSEGEFPDPLQLFFAPSPADNVAWGLGSGSPNDNDMRAQFNGQCDGGSLITGDPIYVDEGVHNSVTQEIGRIINGQGEAAPDEWPANIPGYTEPPTERQWRSNVRSNRYGYVIQGPVALVDAGNAACSPGGGNTSFTGSMDITGFTWAVVYDAKHSGAPGDEDDGKQNVWIQLDPVNEYEVWGDFDPNATGGNVLGLGHAQLME